MLENYGEILLPEEVCEILRISVSEMYRMLKEKEISAYKVGKTWRIPRYNVEAYIRERSC